MVKFSAMVVMSEIEYEAMTRLVRTGSQIIMNDGKEIEELSKELESVRNDRNAWHEKSQSLDAQISQLKAENERLNRLYDAAVNVGAFFLEQLAKER